MSGSDGPQVIPHGQWPSPLTPDVAARGGTRFGGVAVGAGGSVWWSEAVEGRGAVFRAVPEGVASEGAPERVPAVRSARSRVNEYGGGAFWVHGDTLFWVEDDDQRVWRLDPDGTRAVPLTPEPPEPRAWRHAGASVHPDGAWMVLERELHVDADGSVPAEPVNELAAVACSPGVADPVTLVRGPDFTAAPVISPEGRHLAWLQWDHPDMPWDAAELWAAELVVAAGRSGGVGVPELRWPRRVAGGHAAQPADGGDRAVSVCLPLWDPDGRLCFCDDRTDHWIPYRCEEPGLPAEGAGDAASPLWTPDGGLVGGEVGEPRWVAGGSRYGFLADGSLLAAVTLDGLDRLVHVTSADEGGHREVRAVAGVEPTWVEALTCGAGAGDGVGAAVVGTATVPTTVYRVAPDGAGRVRAAAVRTTTPLLEPESISAPEPFWFPSADDSVAHGLFYPPRLAGVVGPAGELPPLVVRIHGGPTAHARAELSASVQFWTTRGIAVVEVNHRGSTGHGRRYRDLLEGGWGVVEVQDCLAAADHLAARGRVDGGRCVIRGGSAGGFTALNALRARVGVDEVSFAAATSMYGVADLTALVAGAHKFESRYLDRLVGPLPEAAATYAERSPLEHAHEIRVPVLVLQGLEDPVVPPVQAETLVAALVGNRVDHEYVVYPGEGHGFRNPDTVRDALARELAFYGRVLGFGLGAGG